jgi:hypothetical protein
VQLEAFYLAAAGESLLLESVRTRLCHRLREQAIPLLLLKGAALALTCYEDPATRLMTDLDVLVPQSRLEEAARCLEADGFRHYELARSVIQHMNRPRRHLIYTHPTTRAVVELHWEVALPRRVRAAAVPEIWEQARPVSSDGAVLMACPGHMIPLLCAHMTLQHKCVTLLWLYDLHRILLTADPSEIMQARDVADRWDLAPATAHALLRVQQLFGTPVPAKLATWAADVASQPGLQGHIAALALVQGAPEMPQSALLNLIMEGDWRFLRRLFPAPQVVRDRFGLAPNERVAPAYATLLARRLRQSPGELRRLWNCLRAARSQPPGRDALPPQRGGAG